MGGSYNCTTATPISYHYYYTNILSLHYYHYYYTNILPPAITTTTQIFCHSTIITTTAPISCHPLLSLLLHQYPATRYYYYYTNILPPATITSTTPISCHPLLSLLLHQYPATPLSLRTALGQHSLRQGGVSCMWRTNATYGRRRYGRRKRYGHWQKYGHSQWCQHIYTNTKQRLSRWIYTKRQMKSDEHTIYTIAGDTHAPIYGRQQQHNCQRYGWRNMQAIAQRVHPGTHSSMRRNDNKIMAMTEKSLLILKRFLINNCNAQRFMAMLANWL